MFLRNSEKGGKIPKSLNWIIYSQFDMRLPPLEKIEYGKTYQIAESLPTGLKKILKKAGMGYHNNGGNQVFRTSNVQITIPGMNLVDRLVSALKRHKEYSIAVLADNPDNSSRYEHIIQNFLDSRNISYQF